MFTHSLINQAQMKAISEVPQQKTGLHHGLNHVSFKKCLFCYNSDKGLNFLSKHIPAFFSTLKHHIGRGFGRIFFYCTGRQEFYGTLGISVPTGRSVCLLICRLWKNRCKERSSIVSWTPTYKSYPPPDNTNPSPGFITETTSIVEKNGLWILLTSFSYLSSSTFSFSCSTFATLGLRVASFSSRINALVDDSLNKYT